MPKCVKTGRLVLVAGAILLWTAIAGSARDIPAGASLSGRWELNRRACEPIPSSRDEVQPPPRGRGPSILSDPSREEMRRVSEPQPVLTIVKHDAHYSVTDEEGHVLRLRPDGVKDRGAWPALDRISRWDGRTLVTEVVLSNGARVTQTYTTEELGLRLVITTRVEGGVSRNTLTYKWVYDQALQ